MEYEAFVKRYYLSVPLSSARNLPSPSGQLVRNGLLILPGEHAPTS